VLVDTASILFLRSLREESVAISKKLKFPTNDSLPLLDPIKSTRTIDEVVDRLLCLHVCAACASGFDRDEAHAWLKKEDLFDKLTWLELEFLTTNPRAEMIFVYRIEAMWALAWIIGVVPQLDLTQHCSDDFVEMMPELLTQESSVAFRQKARLRPVDEVAAACDLAYCLHWGFRHSSISDQKRPWLDEYVVEERRRALDWFLGDEPWHEWPLDT
jgi:hypothetical protein